MKLPFLFWPRFYYHTIKTMWAFKQGRLFVFRDSPRWFLEAVEASLPHVDVQARSLDYILEAIKELNLRRRKLNEHPPT